MNVGWVGTKWKPTDPLHKTKMVGGAFALPTLHKKTLKNDHQILIRYEKNFSLETINH